jgi:hypothetical protein
MLVSHLFNKSIRTGNTLIYFEGMNCIFSRTYNRMFNVVEPGHTTALLHDKSSKVELLFLMFDKD